MGVDGVVHQCSDVPLSARRRIGHVLGWIEQKRCSQASTVSSQTRLAGVPERVETRTSRHAREKSPNTIANAGQLLGTSVLPRIGSLKVDRTTTRRLEGAHPRLHSQ